MKPAMITAFAVFFLVGTGIIVSAEQNAPVPGPGGTYITPYDWIIENGDDILWQDATIAVNGNLTVRSGGKLTLDQVELRMNCTVDGLLSIIVEGGGEMYLNNCVITSLVPTRHYRMILDGRVEMEAVSIREIYGDPANPWDHGIELHSSNIRILNSSFSNCQGDVFHVESSSPLIKGNRFYENMGAAIFTNGTSSPRILENSIYRQRFGIISGFYSSPIIDGNTINDIENNGILLNGFKYPVVSNNTIFRCLNGLLLWYSNARLENNEVHHNEAGYNIKVDSRPTIVGDDIHNNIYVGISVNDSNVEVHDSDIRDNTYDGIRSFNGSSIRVYSSLIENNGDDGFQVTSAHAEVHGSVIRDNDGDSLYLRDHAGMNVFDTLISGGDGSTSFQMNIGEGSGVKSYDSIFNEASVSFGDGGSDLEVFVTCNFYVTDDQYVPLPDISLEIRDETGYRRSVGTGIDGTGSRYLSLYEQSDRNDDGDGADPGEKLNHRYNYSIDEEGYLPQQGMIDLALREQIHIILENQPRVEVVTNSPINGAVDVPVDTSVFIVFDKDIDPDTLAIDLSGPGGAPVFFETVYNRGDRTLEIYPVGGFDHSKTYTLIISEVTGVNGEVLQEPFLFSFRTVAMDEPDNDRDGIPDKDDLDDDNDNYDDLVEEYYGTDPFDETDFPTIGDDDDEPDPGTDPDPPAGDDDDDDDDDIVIIPLPPSDDDDDDTPSPYDPVDTSDEIPEDSKDDENLMILIIGTVIGLLILVGALLLIFFRSSGGHRLVDVEEQQRPPGGG